MPSENTSVVTINPEIMSGTPCFRGTRVPFEILVAYLQDGETLDEFLHQYPTVSRGAAQGSLREMRDATFASLGYTPPEYK